MKCNFAAPARARLFSGGREGRPSQESTMPQFPNRAALAAAILLAAALPLAAQDAAPAGDDPAAAGEAPSADSAPSDAASSDAAPALAADYPVVLESEPMRRAARSLLLDAARTPDGYVALG